jgi:hypothetical protein
LAAAFFFAGAFFAAAFLVAIGLNHLLCSGMETG